MRSLRRIGFALAVLSGLPRTAVAASECERVTLTHPFGYSAAAAWAPDEESLWVADSYRGKLVALGLDGTVHRQLARPGLGRFEFERPTQLFATEDGYLLKNRANHLVWFTADFEPQHALDFRRGSRNPNSAGDVFLLDQVVDEKTGSLIAYGYIRAPGERQAWRGFFELSHRDGAEIRASNKLAEVPGRSLEARFSDINIPVLAKAAGAVWALRLTTRPAIVRQTSPHDRLKAFPAGFDTLPDLPVAKPTNAQERMAIVERSTFPVALYGHGDYLYLVTRRHAEDGDHRWQIHQIDPLRDRLVRSLALPTEAAHVTLAPGSMRWAVLEKASLTPDGDQPIPSILWVPARWITDPGMKSDVLATSCP